MTSNYLPNSLSILFATCTVSFDCNNTVLNNFKLLRSSDTVLDIALNEPSVSDPPDLAISSNVSLEITPSECNIQTISIGKTNCKRLSECSVILDVETPFALFCEGRERIY